MQKKETGIQVIYNDVIFFLFLFHLLMRSIIILLIQTFLSTGIRFSLSSLDTSEGYASLVGACLGNFSFRQKERLIQFRIENESYSRCSLTSAVALFNHYCLN